MSLRKILRDYKQGMAVYDRCHKPNIKEQWQAFTDEVREFYEEPSLAEMWDILHSGGRIVHQLTRIPIHLLALPTVTKHSQRYAQKGCIRSDRNCQKKCRSLDCNSTSQEKELQTQNRVN